MTLTLVKPTPNQGQSNWVSGEPAFFSLLHQPSVLPLTFLGASNGSWLIDAKSEGDDPDYKSPEISFMLTDKVVKKTSFNLDIPTAVTQTKEKLKIRKRNTENHQLWDQTKTFSDISLYEYFPICFVKTKNYNLVNYCVKLFSFLMSVPSS